MFDLSSPHTIHRLWNRTFIHLVASYDKQVGDKKLLLKPGPPRFPKASYCIDIQTHCFYSSGTVFHGYLEMWENGGIKGFLSISFTSSILGFIFLCPWDLPMFSTMPLKNSEWSRLSTAAPRLCMTFDAWRPNTSISMSSSSSFESFILTIFGNTLFTLGSVSKNLKSKIRQNVYLYVLPVMSSQKYISKNVN